MQETSGKTKLKQGMTEEDKEYCAGCRWTNWKTQASNRRKPAKVKNQYGVWDYRSMPQPPKGE